MTAPTSCPLEVRAFGAAGYSLPGTANICALEPFSAPPAELKIVASEGSGEPLRGGATIETELVAGLVTDPDRVIVWSDEVLACGAA